jgi:hypothetical protein
MNRHLISPIRQIWHPQTFAFAFAFALALAFAFLATSKES